MHDMINTPDDSNFVFQTIEDCLQQPNYRCDFKNSDPARNKMWQVVPFFCGEDKICQ